MLKLNLKIMKKLLVLSIISMMILTTSCITTRSTTKINKVEVGMTKNDSVTKSVHIINMGEKEEGQEEEKFYEARIYPNIHEIKQGASQTYVIEYYINDNVASPQEITIEIDRNNVPKQNFVFTTNDNTFTITNKTKYFESPLKVNIKVDDIELNEDYWLVGAI